MFILLTGLGTMVAYGLLTLGGLYVAQRLRKTRWPFKESDKLLRGPGESLRRELVKIDEMFVFELFGVMVSGSIGLAVGLAIVQRLKLTGAVGWSIFATIPLVLVGLCAVRGIRLWRRRSCYYLGWFGERVVAEKLRPLLGRGHHVFHDVPAEPGKRGFNLDHVVVGPSGVVLVEVKTRRKGNARPGKEDHVVTYDGKLLHWPWGTDAKPIVQARAEADWLGRWIQTTTGLRVCVTPVVAIPGWYVPKPPSADVLVVNPSFLPAIEGRQRLEPAQIDLIARQLEIRCRDVDE